MSSSASASAATQPESRVGLPWLEWGVAARPRPGEDVSGDAAVVEVTRETALIAAVDGLGHGPAAADAADRATAVLRGAAGEHADVLVERCHTALRGTRGAAIGIATLDRDRLSWAGVGNVEAWLFSVSTPPAALFLRPGVVGHALPPPQPAAITLRRGDVLVLVSDGVGRAFVEDFHAAGTPQQLANRILAEHAREADDAVVVVVRYLGRAG